MPVTKTRWKRRKEARPQELTAAALELFVEKGFAATRLDEIAARAGVSKGTLYLYFDSKEELFKAVIREGLLPLLAEGEELMASMPGSASELFRAIVLRWWEIVGEGPIGGIPKLIFAEARNFPEIARFYADEVIMPAHRLFEGVIQRGIDRGEFRPVNLLHVAHAVMAPMIFLMLHHHSFGACPAHGPDMDPKATLMAHADLILHGLRRPDAKAADAAR